MFYKTQHKNTEETQTMMYKTLTQKIIFQRESQNSYPDLVQAFPRKWGVESDFKAPNLPLSLVCH